MTIARLSFRGPHKGPPCPNCGSEQVDMLPSGALAGLLGPLGRALSALWDKAAPWRPRMGPYRLKCRQCGWRTEIRVL
jgi:hypothetical protein